MDSYDFDKCLTALKELFFTEQYNNELVEVLSNDSGEVLLEKTIEIAFPPLDAITLRAYKDLLADDLFGKASIIAQEQNPEFLETLEREVGVTGQLKHSITPLEAKMLLRSLQANEDTLELSGLDKMMGSFLLIAA